jgi:hypothetical protein
VIDCPSLQASYSYNSKFSSMFASLRFQVV